MATVTLAARHDLRRPWLAVLLQGLALGGDRGRTVTFRRQPGALLRPPVVLAEVAVGVSLVVCDGVAYGPGHAFATQQSLGVA